MITNNIQYSKRFMLTIHYCFFIVFVTMLLFFKVDYFPIKSGGGGIIFLRIENFIFIFYLF
jgi:hypothetical protein